LVKEHTLLECKLALIKEGENNEAETYKFECQDRAIHYLSLWNISTRWMILWTHIISYWIFFHKLKVDLLESNFYNTNEEVNDASIKN
jgi:hypothetical protein